MKRVIVFLLAVFGVALLSMGLPVKESEAAPKILIKAVSSLPLHNVVNDYYKEFIKRVNEKSKGKMEIKLLGGPEVVSVKEQMKAAATGAVDMIHGSQGYWTGIVPEGTILDLAKHKFELKALRESGVIELYTQAYLERGNVFFLGNASIGMGGFYIVTQKPVSKLEDINGLKIRSIGGLADVLFGQLGASVVMVPPAETYEAIQRGIVDGGLRNPVSLIEWKEYEVLKYCIYPPLISPSTGVFVGKQKWDSIPKNLQTLMKEVMIGLEPELNKYYDEMGQARLKEVQEKHGMKVVHLSDKDIEKMAETRTGTAVRDWIYQKAPKFGLPILEKITSYTK